MTDAFLPMSEPMINASLQTYQKVASGIGGIALAILTARLMVLSLTLGGAADYGDAIKSLVVFYLALALMPVIFKAIVLTSGDLASKVGVAKEVAREGSSAKHGGALSEFWELVSDQYPVFGFLADLFTMSIVYLASSIYSVLLGSLCAVLPVVLLYQTLSNSTQSLSAVSCAILTLSSWPILWNIMGLLAQQLWPSFSHTSLSSVTYWGVIKALQVFSPLFAGMFFKSFTLQGASRAMPAARMLNRKISVIRQNPFKRAK